MAFKNNEKNYIKVDEINIHTGRCVLLKYKDQKHRDAWDTGFLVAKEIAEFVNVSMYLDTTITEVTPEANTINKLLKQFVYLKLKEKADYSAMEDC